jgi:type I restriction enzyme S subunit
MWNTVKLEEIVNIDIGKTPTRNNPKYWDINKKSSNIWVSIRDMSSISSLYIGDSREYISDEGAKLFKEVPKNTLIMSFKLSIGKLAITKINLRTNEAIAAFRIKDESIICKEYLYYYLSSMNWDKIAGQDIKVKGKTLNKAKLKEILILLPPLIEQQRVVSKLDEAFVEIDKIINLTAEIIVKEEDLNLSALKSTFSTIKSKKTIGEIATVIAGQSPEGKYYNRNAKGTPFYQGKKEFGDYELKKPTFWTTKTTKEALKGDVLLSVRAPVGETNMNNDKICIGRGLAAIRANKDNNSEFIYYFLNSIKKMIVGNTGAVFNSINKKQIEDIVIPIQSLDEQNKTINKIKLILSHIKKINLYTKQKLHNLNILKSTILNRELKNRTL